VTIEASQYPFPTVVSGNGEWFQSVRRALRWNTRGAMQKGWNGPSPDDPDFAVDENEDEEWDIDIDVGLGGTDSGVGPSEDGDVPTSPIRRQMSLLQM